jgi:hypothetical protein
MINNLHIQNLLNEGILSSNDQLLDVLTFLKTFGEKKRFQGHDIS